MAKRLFLLALAEPSLGYSGLYAFHSVTPSPGEAAVCQYPLSPLFVIIVYAVYR